jgi:hypothetical protein
MWVPMDIREVVLSSDLIVIASLRNFARASDWSDHCYGLLRPERVVCGTAPESGPLTLRWRNSPQAVCPRLEFEGYFCLRTLWFLRSNPDGTFEATHPDDALPLRPRFGVGRRLNELGSLAEQDREDERLEVVKGLLEEELPRLEPAVWDTSTVATGANLNKKTFVAWLERYARAWETRDPGAAVDLFHEDAIYYWTPFGIPKMGREGIVRAWAEATSRQREIRFQSHVLAVIGSSGIARWACSFVRPFTGKSVALDGTMVVHLNAENLCGLFQEWWHSSEAP